jgi:hypothetical protein
MAGGLAMRRGGGRHAATAVALALLAALALASCGARTDETDLQPPPGYAPPPYHPVQKAPPRSERIVFGEGFYPLESSASGMTWRWMGRRGVVALPGGHPRGKRLRIRGWVPVELMTGRPTLRVTLDDNPLDLFVPEGREFSRDYLIPGDLRAPGATTKLSIETSAPARTPSDTRELGVSITALDWRDDSPP